MHLVIKLKLGDKKGTKIGSNWEGMEGGNQGMKSAPKKIAGDAN